MSLKKHKFLRAIPIVTREETPASCRNSRKSMRLLPNREMRTDSPALAIEPHHIPLQTRQEASLLLGKSSHFQKTP